MAKAVPLTFNTLNTPTVTPQAATPARQVAQPSVVSTVPQKPKVEHVPLQVRIPKEEARAIKVAAAERDMSISDFMLSCFHAFMKA